MPILWRYLIINYLKVFALTVIAFISILLTSRLEEIAHFASFGAEFKLILLFTLLQIPYILPIAIPVACLISSVLLMQRLSTDHELTAIRSAGFSLSEITTPILIASTCIALLNFYIVSELATLSHLKTSLLKSELRSVNPLLLLHNKHLMRMRGIYYDVLGTSKMGQTATNVIIAMPNENHHALNLILAKKLEANDNEFNTEQFSLLTPLKKEEGQNFTDVLFENIQSSTSAIQDFAHLIQKKVTHITHDNLNFGLLLLRLKDSKLQFANLEKNEVNQPALKSLTKSIRQIYSEIARRISAGLAPFTLTLLGLAFGMSISRLRKSLQWSFPLGLSALYLFCFFAGKSLETQVLLAYSLYLIPHIIIIGSSVWKMESISHGVG